MWAVVAAVGVCGVGASAQSGCANCGGPTWWARPRGCVPKGVAVCQRRGDRTDVRVPAVRGCAPSTHEQSPLTFVLLVFGLSVPFWVAGALTDQLMPGLSVSALMAFCPMMAACVLMYRRNGASGLADLLSRSIDFKRVTSLAWYVPALLLMPAVSVLVYALMRWMEMPVPEPQLPVMASLLMFIGFLFLALGEELGWTAYLLDPLQIRWNALQAALILGVVSVMWHLVPLLLLHRTLSWIAWWCLYSTGARILIVWLYNNTGKSVFAVSLFHATLNLAYVAFPVYGSHFDMRLGGLAMAFAAAIVTATWGAKTLARFSVPAGATP